MSAALRTPVGSVLFGQARVLWAAFVLTFVIEVAALASIIYMLNIYDRVVTSRSLVTLVSITAVLVLVYLFGGMLEWIRTQVLVRLALRLDWELAPDVFDAAYRSQMRSKDVNIHQLLGDLVAFKQFLSSAPALALMEMPLVVVFVAVGYLMHPTLAVFTLAGIVVLLMSTYLQQRLTSALMMTANNQHAHANRQAMMLLRHVETSYAMGMERAARRHWYEEHKKHLALQGTASELASRTGGLIGVLHKLLPSLALGVGAYLAIQDQITASMVFAASMLINKAIGPVQKIVGHWKTIIDARQAYARLNDLLAGYRAQVPSMPLPAPQGRFVLTDVSVTPGSRRSPVLEGLSLSIHPGEILAVVGPMGSGKSTLAKALLGIWPPAKGSIRLDGVEISAWDRDEIGPALGYVSQDTGFLEGTVAQNIARLGQVDPQAVVRAAQRVGMHEVILKFPQGYDTPIGEGSGFVMSGGQRQRLSIARAIYRDPRVLILDEPNSAQDEEGEKILSRLLLEFKQQGATVVVVTHRPALVGIADRLLVLKGGRLSAIGPTHEVVQRALRASQGSGTPASGSAGASTSASTDTAASSPLAVPREEVSR